MLKDTTTVSWDEIKLALALEWQRAEREGRAGGPEGFGKGEWLGNTVHCYDILLLPATSFHSWRLPLVCKCSRYSPRHKLPLSPTVPRFVNSPSKVYSSFPTTIHHQSDGEDGERRVRERRGAVWERWRRGEVERVERVERVHNSLNLTIRRFEHVHLPDLHYPDCHGPTHTKTYSAHHLKALFKLAMDSNTNPTRTRTPAPAPTPAPTRTCP